MLNVRLGVDKEDHDQLVMSAVGRDEKIVLDVCFGKELGGKDRLVMSVGCSWVGTSGD